MIYLKKKTLEGSKYPYTIKSEKIFKSSSYIKVLKFLKEQIPANTNVENFEISDSHGSIFEAYNKNGKLTYRYSPLTDLEDFLGNDTPKFKEGDIVEVMDYNELRLGVITGVPLTTSQVKDLKWKPDYSDNVYLVDFSKNTNEHSHPFEFKINFPRFEVSKEEEQNLKDAYEHISSNRK